MSKRSPYDYWLVSTMSLAPGQLLSTVKVLNEEALFWSSLGYEVQNAASYWPAGVNPGFEGTLTHLNAEHGDTSES